MPNVNPSTVVCNLRAVSAFLAIYPSQTVLMALDRLGASPEGIAHDLLDLSGADAVDALDAEILALSWKQAA
jgi:hypothetical protein